MYPLYLHYAVLLELARERERKELEKKSKYSELFRTSEQNRSRNKLGQKIAHRFGTLMIAWGSKLQGINTVPPTDIAVDAKLSR